MDFLVLEKKKTKCVALTVVGLPSSKKIKRNNLKNLMVPFIQLKSAKKDKMLLECVVYKCMAKHMLKGVLGTKGKLKSDANTISNLIRDEKYVDNSTHIFHLL